MRECGVVRSACAKKPESRNAVTMPRPVNRVSAPMRSTMGKGARARGSCDSRSPRSGPEGICTETRTSEERASEGRVPASPRRSTPCGMASGRFSVRRSFFMREKSFFTTMKRNRMAPLRICLVDMNNGVANQATRCFRRITDAFTKRVKLANPGIDVTFRHVQPRNLGELPEGEPDIVLSSGGPGDPSDGFDDPWCTGFRKFLDDALE